MPAMSEERAMLLKTARSLVRQVSRFGGLASGAEQCPKCLPASEVQRRLEAIRIHAQAMEEAGITHQYVMLRGSALHLPYLRRLAFHYQFPNEKCDVCQKQKAKLSHALNELKKEPGDIDLVTVGIPDAKTFDYVQLATRLRREGNVDMTAHLTARQLQDPWHTYSSFFNMDRMKIPSRPQEVIDRKYGRHLGAMLYFLHAYPILTEDLPHDSPETRKRLEHMQSHSSRFVRHLKNLNVEQLREVVNVLEWFMRKESYVLMNPGGAKKDREVAIGGYQEARRLALKGYQNDFFIHTNELHTYNRRHRQPRKKQ